MQNFMKTILSAIQTWTKGKIKESVADWNENDSSKDNYVKNRTHWEETGVVTLVDNLTFTDYDSGNKPQCTFVPEQKYDVIWNGKLYENLVCYLEDTYNVIASNNNGCPFYIDDDGGNGLYIEGDDSNWTVSIISEGTVVHKLDSKYLDLPTNLATTDDVQEVVNMANEAQNTATTAQNTATTAQNTATTAQNTANKKMNTSNPNGTGSFSMNRKSGTTTGYMSVAVGSGTEASGDYSFAEGNGTVASGSSSHVEGRYNYEELYCDKITNCSLTGISTNVYEISGITPDYNKGWYIVETVSSSIGLYGVNIGSHYIKNLSEVTYLDDGTATIKGYMTTTSQDPYQAGIGYKTYFDKIDMTSNKNKYVHIVGNGTSDSSRSNAHTLDWNGVGWFQGGLQVGGNAQDSGAKNVLLVGDAISVPASASVGQVLSIKAVDENGKPTEWECVDFPSGGGGSDWRHIRTVTIPQDPSTDTSGVSFQEKTGAETPGYIFAFDTDENGEPFALTELFIRYNCGTVHTASGLRVNNSGTPSTANNNMIDIPANVGVKGSLTFGWAAMLWFGYGALPIAGWKTGGAVNAQTKQDGYFVGYEKNFLTGICVNMTNNLSNYGFMPGSTFEIWGR